MLFFLCVRGNGAEILSTCFLDLNSNLLVDFSFQKVPARVNSTGLKSSRRQNFSTIAPKMKKN